MNQHDMIKIMGHDGCFDRQLQQNGTGLTIVRCAEHLKTALAGGKHHLLKF